MAIMKYCIFFAKKYNMYSIPGTIFNKNTVVQYVQCTLYTFNHGKLVLLVVLNAHHIISLLIVLQIILYTVYLYWI